MTAYGADDPKWTAHIDALTAWQDNPERTAIRRQAKAKLEHQVASIVDPLGFRTASPGSWTRTKFAWELTVSLQAAQAGDRIYFNFSKRQRLALRAVAMSSGSVRRLGAFYESPHRRVVEAGALMYTDIASENLEYRTALEVLEGSALPWLLSLRNPNA